MYDLLCLSQSSHCVNLAILVEPHATDKMFDWENDEFLSIWDKTYVSTNVKPGDPPFDVGTFTALVDQLNQAAPEISSVSHCIIVRDASYHNCVYNIVDSALAHRRFPAVPLAAQT